jgi:hypothetical protein
MLTDSSATRPANEALESAQNKPGICVRGSGMLTPLQHNAPKRSAASAQEQTLASVSEDQNADSSATKCTTKERWNQRRTRLASVSEGSGMLTPHTMHKSAESAQNKLQHLCRRIRNADSSATHYCKERWNQRKTNTGICVRGIRMLSSATQCTAKERWNQRRTKHWHLCQRIRNADSSATMHCHRALESAQNKPGICVGEDPGMLTPLQHSAAAKSTSSTCVAQDQCGTAVHLQT